MARTFRFFGWALFLVGLGLFFFTGSFETLQDSNAPGHALSLIGMGAALLGMILTSASRLFAHFESVKRLKEQVRNQTRKSPGNRNDG
jgi:hypothetical protein